MNSADALYNHAVVLFDQREFALANDLARQGLHIAPEDGRLWQLHGTACWALDDTAGAITALETATTLMPLFPPAQCALASCYLRTGRPEPARAIYAHLAQSAHCPTLLMPTVAAGLGVLQEYRLALEVCCQLSERQPDHHAAYFGVAYYRARLGGPAAAVLAPLAMAYDLAPHVLRYRLNLAFVLAEVGRRDDAYALLRHIAVDMIRCPCGLRRALDIFAWAGDCANAQACQVLLQRACRSGTNRSKLL